MKVLFSLHYFPCIEYFVYLSQASEVWIEANESFQKQTYRNRTHILSAQGVERLSVPVVKANRHTPIKEIAIDYSEKWENRHWRAIQSAYSKSPFFEHYESFFKELIYAQFTTLFELNEAILRKLCQLLGLPATFRQTDSFQRSYPDIVDLREKIHPKKPHGIISVIPYPQVFGTTFHENLTVLDLLFAEGPNSVRDLKKQTISY